VQDLLTSEVSVLELAKAASTVLGEDKSLEIKALNNLIQTNSNLLAEANFSLGEILNIYEPNTQVEGILATKFSLGELLNAGVFVANMQNSISIDDLE